MTLKHAQRRDIVARNVAELSEMPTSAREARSGRSLTPEQARQLLDVAADDRLGGLVTVGVMLGHTNTRMLVKHYLHPISRMIDAAAAPCGAPFRG
jgi:hypothetical protein